MEVGCFVPLELSHKRSVPCFLVYTELILQERIYPSVPLTIDEHQWYLVVSNRVRITPRNRHVSEHLRKTSLNSEIHRFTIPLASCNIFALPFP